MAVKYVGLLLAVSSLCGAQELKEILERLDRVEEQNRQLLEEVRALRQQISPAPATAQAAEAQASAPPPAEQLAVHEQRIAELDQTKIGSDQRFPISLTGTVLFNAFINGRNSNGQMNTVVAGPEAGAATDGASLRQTVLGFRFNGPDLPGGGKASGTLFLDFFGGAGTSLTQLVRLRVATLDLAWKNTTVSLGQDKPILSPREPDSLAQVGVSPLTGAGNLWLWSPQARVEQRLSFGENAGLRAQAGVYQTGESGAGVPAEYASTLGAARPGIEGRFEFWAQAGGSRIEIAPGFHTSDTHVLGQSVPSRIGSIDWLIRPWSRAELTGQFFSGENVGVIGGLRQGVTISPEQAARPVHATGGWAQLAVRITPRMTFHFYGGQEDDRNADLAPGSIAKNQEYAANIMYRLAPNVLTSFEFSQLRTTFLGGGTFLNPHYDLALAYLF
jgi:hypothetical protein